MKLFKKLINLPNALAHLLIKKLLYLNETTIIKKYLKKKIFLLLIGKPLEILKKQL
jgi:hypothetical protein